MLNLVWDKLLPALKPTPLPADDESHKKLEHTLRGLTLRPQEGSARPAKVSGKKFVFPANGRKLEAITLESDDKCETLIARFAGADQRISCGRGEWKKGRLAFATLAEQPAAASGAWTSDDTYTVRICFTETPFIHKISLKFSGNQVFLDAESNVGFGSTHQPKLVGKAE